MCGRFTISKTEQELEKRFGANFYSKVLEARYNVAPTQNCAVIRDRKPDEIELLRWGLVPIWAKDEQIGSRMINARIESVTEKPAFKKAFQSRRCLVLADGWYEWEKQGKNKIPQRIVRKDREAFAMAGIWERWRPKGSAEDAPWLKTFSIITQPAVKKIEHIHDRMPSVIPKSLESAWLKDDLSSDELLKILEPIDEEELDFYTVSKAVGNTRNEYAELLEEEKPSEPSQGSLF
jgi:putative SOS response-associated peptidase YedK